jgi:hypothetical protein
MLHPKHMNQSSRTYAAWLEAATVAHRTADPEAKARAERLHMEHKIAAKRERSRRARMSRNN